MKFYVLKYDYESILQKEDRDSFRLYGGTSVIRYKKWFFESLRQYGEIITFDEGLKREKLLNFLNKPGAIFASVHGFLDEHKYHNVPRRMLTISMGTLLVHAESLYMAKLLPSAQVLLISTEFQAERLQSIFDNLMPQMYVFPPEVDTGFFMPPDKREKAAARKKYGIKEGQIHILYAGRWIVTKGICQLIRTLTTYPIPKMVLTLAGNIEEDNKLVYSFARHKIFPNFLDNEIFQKRRNRLQLQPAKYGEELRELFWSADLFVYPSIQPDEAFGHTPHEAASCGLPVVITNFGGLYNLAEDMPWKGLDTYPTLWGCRFSLRQLHRLLKSAIQTYKFYSPQDYRKSIINKCDPAVGKRNLGLAIEYLKDKPAEKPLNVKIREGKVKKRLFNMIDERALKLFINARQELPPGSCVYGDGPSHYAFPIVQGLYSAKAAPPIVEKKTRWRGFFRISMWKQEKTLVEFGFPGPRIKRYSKKQWDSLRKCTHLAKTNDYVIIPVDKLQISLAQELVDSGYLVSDD